MKDCDRVRSRSDAARRVRGRGIFTPLSGVGATAARGIASDMVHRPPPAEPGLEKRAAVEVRERVSTRAAVTERLEPSCPVVFRSDVQAVQIGVGLAAFVIPEFTFDASSVPPR